MDFALEMLNHGHWVHMYPQGQVNLNPKENTRFKWGVGRLITESNQTPIVIPIYHLGMDSILPNRKPYIPRFGQKVTIVVGSPINVQEILDELKKTNASALECRLKLTNLIQDKLYALRISAEIYHGKHLAGVQHTVL